MGAERTRRVVDCAQGDHRWRWFDGGREMKINIYIITLWLLGILFKLVMTF